MILNSANDTDKQLSRYYASIEPSGLASIRYQGDSHLFDIAWWGSEKGISAQQQLVILHDDEGWRLAQTKKGGTAAQRRKINRPQ